MTDTTTTIPDQPDGIEDDSYDLPELGRAAERVREYICAWGDGLIVTADGHPLYARDLEALRRAADHVWAGEQLRDEVEKLRAALTQSRAQAATYANEIGNLTAENARQRSQGTWEAPAEPTDVTAVRDRAGQLWVCPGRPGNNLWWHDQLGRGIGYEWHQLLVIAGPLTPADKAEATR